MTISTMHITPAAKWVFDDIDAQILHRIVSLFTSSVNIRLYNKVTRPVFWQTNQFVKEPIHANLQH